MGGWEFWSIAVLVFLLLSPFALAALFTLLAHGRDRHPRPPVGWVTDPSATHELRYWDGSTWTDNVRDGGVQSIHRCARKAPAPLDGGYAAVAPVVSSVESGPAGRPFWTKRRIAVAVTLVVLALLVPFAVGGFSIWRFYADEAARMETMREFVDEAYPDYEVVDSTRFGYILQHKKYAGLRLDVRFDQGEPVWDGVPREALGDGWFTHETFFRHAEGMPQGPLWPMNFDVEGFAKAYQQVRPGPNSVISAVWLEDPWDGVEKYVVLVARRNRSGSSTEPMWPDHVAYFTRDIDTGEWTAYDFLPADDPDAWYPPYLDEYFANYGDPDEAAVIAEVFLEELILEQDFAEAFEDTDPAMWEGGTAAEFEQMVAASPGYGEVTDLELIGFRDPGINPSLQEGDFEIFVNGTAADRTIYYRVKMRRDEKGAYRPVLLTVQEKPYPPAANMARF